MNRASRYSGKKQIKTEGKKEHYVAQHMWDEETILNSNNKKDADHSTEGYIQTIIKTLPVQYKGQYKGWCLAVTATNYSQ